MTPVRGAGPLIMTAAGIAAMGFVVGPEGTGLYAMGAAVGAGTLLASLRQAAAARGGEEAVDSRCTGCAGCGGPACAAPAADTAPDASGRAPETTRTHPDDTGQQPADQAGNHPDDPRNDDQHCEVITLDGNPVRVTSDAPLDDIGRQHLATIVAAARRRYAAEHLDQGDTP